MLTDTVLMIRPASFGFNDQTADTNPFQKRNGETDPQIKEQALKEFGALVSLLKNNGIDVKVYQDTKQPPKPDAIFPNNWISVHKDKVITYPMYAPNRRLERRQDIVADQKRKHLDLSSFEDKGRFLEGTGSLVLDRDNKIAYACISKRTHETMLSEFSRHAGYRIVKFYAYDFEGGQLYHTNVMMYLGEGFAVVCLEVIKDPVERQALVDSLEATGHEVIGISFGQFKRYAGNGLALKGSRGQILVMSDSAYDSLDTEQKTSLKKYAKIITCSLATIERYGGGSARCMLTEIF